MGFNKQFVDNPTNDYELKIDYNLDKELETEKFKIHFIQLIINRYIEFIQNNKIENIPDAVINSKKEWIDADESNIINKFMLDYQLTDNINDYVKSCDIKLWLDNHKLGITMKNFSIELNKHNKIKKLNNIESKDKKINGKCFSVWVGIKWIIEEEEEINPLDL